MSSIKDASNEVITRLPSEATWNDLMYELYVKQKIEAGLQAAAEGRVVSHEEVKQRFTIGDLAGIKKPVSRPQHL